MKAEPQYTWIKQTACRHCNGTGKEIDQVALGQYLKARRLLARVGLRDLAKKLKISAMYLCDLEHGRRAWSTERIAEYLALTTPA